MTRALNTRVVVPRALVAKKILEKRYRAEKIPQEGELPELRVHLVGEEENEDENELDLNHGVSLVLVCCVASRRCLSSIASKKVGSSLFVAR